ncbi:hypothetical protein [Shouchella lehensis]|uniref:Uncharacterized protein n=2 Tax=Shouchella lehensis TaxID=300825 RepID=A0A4Y7WLE3_9BACI|nr:hypothetical protein [Shouchella lehensis]MBG9783212.1 hypothetical protein [Shouchella lehensis]TES49415.1 hypothetical protein E2L03_08060 [Shouchella lehensis]
MDLFMNMSLLLPIGIAVLGWILVILFRRQPTKIVWIGISKLVVAFLLFVLFILGEEAQANETGLGMTGARFLIVLLPSAIMVLVLAFTQQYKVKRSANNKNELR